MIASIRCPLLVGRADETAFLRSRLAEAERGDGSIVFVTGDAGIGKTRLVGDFLQLPELRRIPRAIGYAMEHARSPLAPLADIAWSLVDESPDLLKDAHGTRKALANLIPSSGAEEDPGAAARDARSRYAAFVDLFRLAAARQPIVVVIEDAQWADLSTIDFITFFASRLRGTRTLLLVMQRSLRSGADPLAESYSRVRSNGRVFVLPLLPLPLVQMRKFSELALAGSDGLSEDRLRQVHALADGNPLFAEELLATAVGNPDAEQTLPASLRSLFLDRFSALADEDRETLTEAAVMGREFDPVFLARLTGRPIERLLRTLRTARELQLVDDTQDGIVFRHALVRETLYASLLGAEARRLHRRMAEELESLPETMNRSAAIAYHWWAAKDLERAFDANLKAGERAMHHLATTDAALFFERALACEVGDDATRANTEYRLAIAYFNTAFPDKGIAALTRALAHFGTAGDLEKITDVSIELGRHTAATGDGEASRRWRLAAIDAAEQLDDPIVRYKAYAHYAFHLTTHGELTSAQEYVSRAERLNVEPPISARIDLDESAMFVDILSGRFEEADRRFALLMAYLQQHGSNANRARVYINNAVAQHVIGKSSIALRHAQFAVEQNQADVAPAARIIINGVLSGFRLAAGDISGARSALGEAEEIVAALGQTSSRFTATLPTPAILLGIHTGDTQIGRPYEESGFLEDAFSSGEYFWTYALVSAFAQRAVQARNFTEAASILARFMRAQAEREMPMVPEIALLVARYGEVDDIETASRLLARWPAFMPSLAPFRDLFAALVAHRNGRAPKNLAQSAAQTFLQQGRPLLAATALEIADDIAGALAIYERYGCTGDVARLRGTTPSRLGELSPRERDILPHVQRGRSNAEIARDLSISERTVESHVRSILAKRGVKSRVQLLLADG